MAAGLLLLLSALLILGAGFVFGAVALIVWLFVTFVRHSSEGGA